MRISINIVAHISISKQTEMPLLLLLTSIPSSRNPLGDKAAFAKRYFGWMKKMLKSDSFGAWKDSDAKASKGRENPLLIIEDT